MRRSAAVYHKFTEEEIRQANSVDILSLARGYGYEPEKAGRKAVHMKHSGGLYIFPENNRFFQWTGPDDGIKGGAIDFVMREENLSFPEAVGKLIGKEYVAETREERARAVGAAGQGGEHEAGLLVSGVRPGYQPTNRQSFYEPEDDLSGEKVWQLRVCRLRFRRGAPVLFHAGCQRKQFVQDGRHRLR